MLLKIYFLCCLALIVSAKPESTQNTDSLIQARAEQLVVFETSHKRPDTLNENNFQTSHKISIRSAADVSDYSMNLLPTKERPELNPVLSALINEDVMKSIEAKRAIELEELEAVRREAEAVDAAAPVAVATQRAVIKEQDVSTIEPVEQMVTEAPVSILTTISTPIKKNYLDDEEEHINIGFVDQTINLDAAGSENNKKSRIEIKKGPNGQDYEYEYVYYYEDDEDDDDSKAKPAIAAPATVEAPDQETRGKIRYTNIERSTTATPSENSLQSGKAKGRSSSVANDALIDEPVEVERLPTNTRFPSRGKNIEVPPTPALDSLENAAEKKKISVKRPSLELVDSETFNTDEKQAKGARNGDNELKPAIAIEQELAAAAAAKAVETASGVKQTSGVNKDTEITAKANDEEEQTTPSMEKAALDLYAILMNENLNNDMTTIDDTDVTTSLPYTIEDDGMTTLQFEESTPSTTTTTTTTTTTEAPTTTTTTTKTTTTTAAPTIFGGRRAGIGLAGRNRFKLSREGTTTTSTTTEVSVEPTAKAGRNRFSRPSIGGRNRPAAKTTASPESTSVAEEEVVAAKEAKPVSSSFGRNKPRNRFNLRGSTTTTERSSDLDAYNVGGQEDTVSSTTARILRGRPGLNLRGRSRTTTTKAPASDNAAEEVNSEEKSTPAEHSAPVRPSRFNINRPGGNRLLPRGKLGRGNSVTTEAPKENEDSAAADSSHNDIKGAESESSENAEKTESDAAFGNAALVGPGGLNRLKGRPRFNTLSTHKTESAKSKASPATEAIAPPRKINPLLAKRRLQLGSAAASSTTESITSEEDGNAAEGSAENAVKDEAGIGQAAGSDDGADNAKEQDTTETLESTTKQQARGLGLLGQRRRLPLRKPGTIL